MSRDRTNGSVCRFIFTVSLTAPNLRRGCWTISPTYASGSLVHLHLYILTELTLLSGVITYSTNLNTSAVIRNMAQSPARPLRIVLETDAPFMIPANIYSALPTMKGRMPISHAGMIPWTAEFVANVAGDGWDIDRVMREARENAKNIYGV